MLLGQLLELGARVREDISVTATPMATMAKPGKVVKLGKFNTNLRPSAIIAPSSGEGIYYAMVGGRVAATACAATLASGRVKDLKLARKLFMREHKTVFRVLASMQNAYYRSDNRRERFVSLCHDIDVQKLTFEAYMNKKLVKARPMAHLKIGLKNIAHLTGLVRPEYT